VLRDAPLSLDRIRSKSLRHKELISKLLPEDLEKSTEMRVADEVLAQLEAHSIQAISEGDR
jgi:hypothetical protein